MVATTFIIRLAEALAWPAIVGYAFWNLRGPIAARIANLRTLKYKDAEATFGEALDRVEDDRAPPPTPLDQAPDVLQIAAELKLPPAYIVQQAWLRVEQALVKAAMVTGSRTSPRAATMIERANLSAEDQALLRELRRLRNDAVHSSEPHISVIDALRYKDLAESLVRRIENGQSS